LIIVGQKGVLKSEHQVYKQHLQNMYLTVTSTTGFQWSSWNNFCSLAVY